MKEIMENTNKVVKVKVTQSCPILCEFSRPDNWSGQLFPSPGDLPIPGIKPRSPALQVDSLPAEPPRESKNTGSVSFLQGIFLTQESNQGFLHYRRILYSLTTREAQISGKIFHANGLEELLLKYPYYSKQSMELMHSLSKCQWHVSQNWYI